MAAALSGNNKSVELLLSYGADPDMEDMKGRTALIAAIMGGVNSTIDILAQFTRAQVSETVGFLARYHQQVEFSKPLVQFVKKCTTGLVFRLGQACFYGATNRSISQLTRVMC